MPEAHGNKIALRLVVAGTAVIWSLESWYFWMVESHSYPIGPQDFGLPITFRRVYYPDIVLFFPLALLFDAVVAVLVVVAVASCFWRWSTSWSTGHGKVFVLGFAVFVVCMLPEIRRPISSFLPNLIASIMMLIAVPIVWVSCLGYASVIAGGHIFGKSRALWLPTLLTLVLSGMGWLCQPQDIYQSDRSPENTRGLVERLSDSNPHIRALALSALHNRGPYDEPTALAIIQSMSDPDTRVQDNAFSLASDLGLYAIKAVPVLRKKFMTNGSCTFELALLGPIAKDAVPDLKERLPAASGYGKLGICEALWRIESNPKDIVSSLIELLDDEFGPIRVDAAELLGEIGPDAKDAVSKLEAMVAYVPKVETPQPIDLTSPVPAPRPMTEAEFYPQIRDAARVALSKIVQPE